MSTYAIRRRNAWNLWSDRAAPPRRALVAALTLLCALALASPAAALEQKLTAMDGAVGDRLGRSVAVDGDTLVLGAPEDDGAQGAVYVYRRSGDSWTQTAKLTASDGAMNDELGLSVAIDGDTIVAGAPSDTVGANVSQGSVYTFTRGGAAARTETAKLTAGDGATNDEFGNSVAIDGDTIVAGAHGDNVGANAGQGSVYTFTRAGGAARTQTAKLTAGDGAAADEFGSSVAIDGDTIVAGAESDNIGANADQGSVYTFTRVGAAARTQTAKLTASDGAAADLLGGSVAIDGDTIAAGALFDEIGANARQGSVYTFTRAGADARSETAKLTASDGAANDHLGTSVAVDGDTIAAGAQGDDVGANDAQGSVYTFTRAGAAARTQTATLTASDGALGDGLGGSVAIDGDTIAAGAESDTVGADVNQGSASVFFAPATPPAGTTTTATATTPPSRAKPVLSRLKVSPNRFRRASSPSKIAGSRAGTRITFTLSEAATVKLTFTRAEPGRSVAKTCRKPTRSNRTKRPCTRSVTVGSFTVRGQAGRNAVAFTGTLPHGKRLAPGSYTLTATPTDNAHNAGQPRSAKLKVMSSR
jgi:hypothetical protein